MKKQITNTSTDDRFHTGTVKSNIFEAYMFAMLRITICILPLLLINFFVHAQVSNAIVPRKYTAQKTHKTLVIDGRAEEAWDKAPWSEPFTDIEGGRKPAPYFTSRLKMLWDDDYLYVFAQLEEPDLWATLTNRDAIIFRDDDFEVFIDPDHDQKAYFEFEINTFGIVMDLFMDKTYKNGGKADLGWNAAGLLSAVAADGTINQNNDTDKGWAVEMAIPFKALSHAGTIYKPESGAVWKINFSRVQWTLDKDGNTYKKRTGADGKPLPEHNWVWSPQGIIDMHVPQYWGLVHFTDQQK